MNNPKPEKEYPTPTRYGRQYAYRIDTTTDAWDVLHKRAKEIGLTDGEVANLIGTTQTTITNWNSRKRSPTLENIQRLCETIGAELEINIRIRPKTPAVKRILNAKQRQKAADRRKKELERSIRWADKKDQALHTA